METQKAQENKFQNTEIKYAQPIRACILEQYNIDNKTKKIINSIEKNGIDIDYYANEDVYRKNNMKNAGPETYAISEINEKSKSSYSYRNCTGIIVVGKNKKGKEVSFMSHQDPTEFLDKKKEVFINDLSQRIKEILEKTKKDTIDAIIFGGKRADREYQDSIKLLGDTLKKELGFEPTVMTGPNLDYDGTNIFFDTQNRRLYIVRNEQPEEKRSNESYLPSEIDEKKKDWY